MRKSWAFKSLSGIAIALASAAAAGQEYSFRVQTVSSAGISGYSEVATQKAA